MTKLKAATLAVVKAAKEFHTASKLEELTCHHPDSSAWLQADQRLILAREAHYNAVEALLNLETPKVIPKEALTRVHYSGGLRWTSGTKLTRLLAGFPACTQKRKTNDWKLSENLRKVTCLRCLHLIKLSENSS